MVKGALSQENLSSGDYNFDSKPAHTYMYIIQAKQQKVKTKGQYQKILQEKNGCSMQLNETCIMAK